MQSWLRLSLSLSPFFLNPPRTPRDFAESGRGSSPDTARALHTISPPQCPISIRKRGAAQIPPREKAKPASFPTDLRRSGREWRDRGQQPGHCSPQDISFRPPLLHGALSFPGKVSRAGWSHVCGTAVFLLTKKSLQLAGKGKRRQGQRETGRGSARMRGETAVGRSRESGCAAEWAIDHRGWKRESVLRIS